MSYDYSPESYVGLYPMWPRRPDIIDLSDFPLAETKFGQVPWKRICPKYLPPRYQWNNAYPESGERFVGDPSERVAHFFGLDDRKRLWYWRRRIGPNPIPWTVVAVYRNDETIPSDEREPQW